MRLAIFLAILLFAPIATAQQRTQIHFKEPASMKVFWVTQKDGKPAFSTVPLETPGRYNFVQGAGYRLKLTHLPGHPGLELLPTLEVHACASRSREFLAHNSVPIVLTGDEIGQVVKGSLLVKVVYLPDQQGGDAEIAMMSGQDAVGEAARRGRILLVLRIGNIRFDD